MAEDDRETEVEELETAETEEEAETEVEETEAEVETEAEAETEDETEVEAEAEDAEEPEGQSRTRESRGANLRHRAQRAETEARELRERLARVEGRLEGIGTRQQVGPSAEERAAEAERLALMSPEERADYRIQQAERRIEARFNRSEFTLRDQNDKAAFEAKAVSDPRYARYADRVETELGKFMAQGQWVPRDRLLRYLIGDDAMKHAAGAKTRQQRRADTDRQRQTTTPRGGARSDAQTTRGKGAGKTAAEKLENVTF